MRIVAGIDPGLDGGVAVLNDVNDVEVTAIPTMGEGKNRIVDCGQLVRWLVDRDVNEAIIEFASAHADQGRASIFRFGVSFGQILGALQGMAIPYEIVSPLRWKRHYGLLNNRRKGVVVVKDDSRRKAIELFPRHAAKFERKNSVHCAEAALLARYAVLNGQSFKRRVI